MMIIGGVRYNVCSQNVVQNVISVFILVASISPESLIEFKYYTQDLS